MGGVFDWMFDEDLAEVLGGIVTVAVAFLVAIPIAWDRERAARSAGMRTFPLIAAVSAAYVIIAQEAFAETGGGDHARILHGLMTGLGFLGAGAIIQARGERVRGMATAVTIWSTAAIGAAIAYGRLDIALVLVAIDLIGLRFMRPLKRAIGTEPRSEPRRGEPAPSSS